MSVPTHLYVKLRLCVSMKKSSKKKWHPQRGKKKKKNNRRIFLHQNETGERKKVPVERSKDYNFNSTEKGKLCSSLLLLFPRLQVSPPPPLETNVNNRRRKKGVASSPSLWQSFFFAPSTSGNQIGKKKRSNSICAQEERKSVQLFACVSDRRSVPRHVVQFPFL